MPSLKFTVQAVNGLQRCRAFLASKNPRAAERAGSAILEQLSRLEAAPEIGRPVAGTSGWRELVIPFADSGYVALYVHVPDEDTLYVLAVRHQKEAGF